MVCTSFVCRYQENNAWAVLDLTTMQWVDLYPMGVKSFSAGGGSGLDASDRDDSKCVIDALPVL